MNKILEYQIPLFIFLGAVVFALAIYLGFLFTKLKQQKNDQDDLQKKFDEKLKEQDYYFKDSLVTLARATLSGQCDLSECCIRVRKILEYYPELEANKDFGPIITMYEQIKIFPTHQERLDQSKQEIFEQDKKRFEIENDFRESVHNSLEKLIQHIKI